MTFSVIIPAYNCAGTLESTVRSIQLSGLYDYEIILVDDGSTDGTAALCDELGGKFAEIRCVHQQNAGVSAARNRGIAEAQGEYLWFVDADDTVDEGSITDAAKAAEEQKPDMLIFGMSFDFYHKGKVYRRESLVPPYDGAILLEQLKSRFKEFYDCNSFTSACNKFCRKDIIVEHKIAFHKDMILMEDFLFVLELLAHCENIYCVPKAIYRYKQAENEKNAFRRLERIDDLTKYMAPFEAAAKNLGGESVILELYKMLLTQRLYYAALKDIKRILNAQESSKYYQQICMPKPLALYIHNKKTRLRHRIAVAVKSSRIYKKAKGGA